MQHKNLKLVEFKNIEYFGCKKISELKHEPKNNP